MKRNNRDFGGPKSICMLLVFAVSTLCVLAQQEPVRAAPPSPVMPDLVNRKVLKSIDRGLRYLHDTQRRDGSWLNQGGYGMYPAVMTGLSGLALMAGGSTPETGPYAKDVAKAMNYLLRVAETHADGLVAGPGAEYRSMYGHGFAMLFLAQCYGMELNTTTEAKLRKVLTGGVQLIVKSQSKKTSRFGKPCGGWYYTPGSSSDEGSVTVTQLQALRACRNVGIKVPKDCIEKAVEYLRHCQMADGGICYSASSRGSSRPPISAAAIACFYAAGVYDRTTGGKGTEAEMVEKLVRYVDNAAGTGSSGGGHWFYTQFYLSQVKYQQGKKPWKTYYPVISQRLTQMQNPDGSWNGDSVGTTYGTAIATMILQLPYGYLPIVQR
ncbi:MAG: terpene cyclase/mutase family protein [Phycisphaerae bacterium]|jgi:hypothetical protein|nr:terpene cyclase/mutase family protein [Phycisphaerae bacterium]MDP7286667.1 terpene cyclase/mutase family protein [Phycisphaerae bacterium]